MQSQNDHVVLEVRVARSIAATDVAEWQEKRDGEGRVERTDTTGSPGLNYPWLDGGMESVDLATCAAQHLACALRSA